MSGSRHQWRTNLCFVTSWRTIFQGLTQQIFLKLQLLVIVEVHDLTAPAAIKSHKAPNRNFDRLLMALALGLDEITLNLSHLTVDSHLLSKPLSTKTSVFL